MSIKKQAEIALKSKTFLFIQRFVAFVFFLILYTFVWLLLTLYSRYSIRNLRKVRKTFKSIVRNVKGPLIICPNHFTFIDSLVIHIALASPWFYLTHFYSFSWNVPEKKNARKSWVYRLIAYLGKCVLVERGGLRKASIKSLKKMRHLLTRGDYLMIFSEGRRTLTKRVDSENTSYAIGKLLQEVPKAMVLCVYFRGDSQKFKSVFPKRFERFYIDLLLLSPKSLQTGRREVRDLSLQVMNQLIRLEEKYFTCNLQTWK
jgi:1-acyl-sn-glycerol-3-phosphate acyltransferase